jgi:RimJ/RimL family protein N-acetyltransferase
MGSLLTYRGDVYLSMNRLPLMTHSLLIRPLVREDAREIYLLSGETAYRTWLPSQLLEDERQASSVLEFLISKYADPGDPRFGPYVLAIEHRIDRVLIGHVGFSPFENEVEIGFAIGERYQGRGLATEAVVAASQWTLDAFGLERILGIASALNSASISTLKRAQFLFQKDRIMMFQGTEQLVAIYALMK